MKAPRDSLATRLVLEFLVIVLGVLVALAADRLNQDRLARVLEAEYVDRLIADIRSDSVLASDYLARFDQIELARDSLVRFVDGDIDLASVVSTVMRAFQQFNLPTPATWNELIGGGSLGVIGDPRVRAIVSEYYMTLRADAQLQLSRSDRRGRDPFTDVLYPMGLFLPCVGDQDCAPQGESVSGDPDASPSYREMAPEEFRDWPDMRALLVGLGSHHGSQRLFASRVLDTAVRTLRALDRRE